MSKKYNIGGKYKLIQKISEEAFGVYHTCEDIDGKKYTAIEMSGKLTSPILESYQQLYKKLNPLDTNNDSIIPVLEIIITNSRSYIIMPYHTGMPLGKYLSSYSNLSITSNMSLNNVIKLLSKISKTLSLKHSVGLYHGFINFSTVWITNENKLMLVGFDFFKLILTNIDINYLEFNNEPKIISCINKDKSHHKLSCSISSDYYSILTMVYSLLHGKITSPEKQYISNYLSAKTKKLLSIDYNRELFQKKHSLSYWFKYLKYSNNKNTVLTSVIAISITITLVQYTYQYQRHIKNTHTYNYLKSNYKIIHKKAIEYTTKIGNYYYSFYSNKLNQAYDYINKIKYSFTKTNSNSHEFINKLINLSNTNNNKMKYVSKKDYYTYCYLSDECDVETNKLSVHNQVKLKNCIFDNKCEEEIKHIVKQPILGLTQEKINNYINWLNKYTNNNYNIISD